MLADHLVLTTSQITQALFGSPRACQQRLARLRRLELADRFTPPRSPHGGSVQAHWTLGRLGLDLHAAARGDPTTTPRAAKTRVARLAERPSLPHLLGVNGFFSALLGRARQHTSTTLTRWWSEPVSSHMFPGVFPDGHGLWREAGATVGFFLEFDTGTEALAVLVDKLGGYEQLARDQGPIYPVLFSLHSHRREANLHAALGGRQWLVPVATAVRPTPDPSAAVWAVVGAGTANRARLTDLPSDNGPNHRRNPNWTDATRTADITGDTHPQQ
jgi:protein involved in plasmid replication-relaxation